MRHPERSRGILVLIVMYTVSVAPRFLDKLEMTPHLEAYSGGYVATGRRRRRPLQYLTNANVGEGLDPPEKAFPSREGGPQGRKGGGAGAVRKLLSPPPLSQLR